MELTQKEIARADETYNGRRYTIVKRPYEGKIRISLVWVDTGEVYDTTIVDSEQEVGFGIKSMLRFMGKMGAGGPMADSSRHRR